LFATALVAAIIRSAGPLSPEELARKTGTHPRIIREWLAAQAAGGIVAYDPPTQKYTHNAYLQKRVLSLHIIIA
jgi:predicted transcriptional regulator